MENPNHGKEHCCTREGGADTQIHDGQWLFKALLAPKTHQEHVSNIEDFIWQFCVNYIPLNQVTCLIVYPIPCWDIAVKGAFGGSWIWMYGTTP
jgi:hypothetical protein